MILSSGMASKKKHHSGRKWTIIRFLKWTIALGPPIVGAASWAGSQGQIGSAKWGKSFFDTLILNYSGYSLDDGQFHPSSLVVGYLPLGAAYVFGKIASRVLR